METVDNRSFKEKVHDARVRTVEWISDRYEDVKTFCQYHPLEATTIAVTVISGGLKCVNSAMRLTQQARETRYNECDVYDPRTGTHYYTRKPLTNTQKLNLETRYRAGEDKGKILYDMKML